MIAIECHNLTKRYKRAGRSIAAVDQLDLRIESGQVYGFLGPNGAGKTTTIRMLLNLAYPNAGEVRLFGHPVRQNLDALKNVGALVEGASFYPYLSAWDNLKILGWSGRGFDETRAHGLLNELGLLGRENDKVAGYSTGMQQRLGLVAALLHDPDLLILDEPTNGLDPAGIHELRDFLRRLVDERGKTVFLSSHLLSEVQQTCDRVAIIQKGRLLAEGDVTELLRRQSLTAHEAILEVEPVEMAQGILVERWQAQLGETRGTLVVHAEREALPEIVRLLVAADVQIYAMQVRQASLEDFFLSVTEQQATP